MKIAIRLVVSLVAVGLCVGLGLSLRKKDLPGYLGAGIAALDQSDFEKAKQLFQSADGLDPGNTIAYYGIRAAERGVRWHDGRSMTAFILDDVREAIRALELSRAIAIAKYVQGIQVPDDDWHVGEATRLIAEADRKRAEIFGPVVNVAMKRYELGDFQTSRELCGDILSRDPANEAAKTCTQKADDAIAAKRAQ